MFAKHITYAEDQQRRGVGLREVLTPHFVLGSSESLLCGNPSTAAALSRRKFIPFMLAILSSRVEAEFSARQRQAL
jgi:hypothetical protein